MVAGRIITQIEVQKGRRSRVSIFLDDEFAFGLDLQVAIAFNLKKGDVLSSARVNEVLKQEEKSRVKTSAFRYLGRRAHSESELRTKLDRKGYDSAIITKVIEELTKAGYLDDLEFARSFARSRLLSKPMGARRMRSELWQRGVAEQIIDTVVAEAYRERPERELVEALLAKRGAKHLGLDEKVRMKRLHDFLLRRGFGWDVVSEVLGTIANE